jgi:hypothetical protein
MERILWAAALAAVAILLALGLLAPAGGALGEPWAPGLEVEGTQACTEPAPLVRAGAYLEAGAPKMARAALRDARARGVCGETPAPFRAVLVRRASRPYRNPYGDDFEVWAARAGPGAVQLEIFVLLRAGGFEPAGLGI